MARSARAAVPGCAPLGLAAALLLASGRVQAQVGSAENAPPASGFRITPYAGWAPSVARHEIWSYTGDEGGAVREQVDMKLTGGIAAGLTLQLPVARPVGLHGGVTYLDRGAARFVIDQGGDEWVFTGSRSVLVKAGVALDLQGRDDMAVRRLGAGVFVAPFYMIEMPKKLAGIDDPGLFDAASHFGVNFGVTGMLPLARDRLALLAGFEDYLTFWNERSLRRLPDWLHNAPASTGTTVTAEPTHQWLVRAGLSIRVH